MYVVKAKRNLYNNRKLKISSVDDFFIYFGDQ